MGERERRKSPRFSVRFRVYFPEYKVEGRVTNISMDGCHIQVTSNLNKEGRVELIVELPVVGPIWLTGYIHYNNSLPSEGIGLQFIHVGFSPEETIYYSVFSRFIKVISQLEDLRTYYRDSIAKEGIEQTVLPPEIICW